MRIEASQPDLTVIQERPLFVPALSLTFVIIGILNLVSALVRWNWNSKDAIGILICFVVGGGIFLYSARRAEYRFDHRSRRLVWRSRSFFGRDAGTIDFDEIHKVLLHRGPDNDDTTHRVVLETSEGIFPLSNAFTANKGRLEDVVTAIEAALRLSG